MKKGERFLHRHNRKVNDLTVSYIDEGSGEVLVLIHGFCGSPAYWEKVIPALSENYRIIAPALRGHGKSSSVSDPYTIEDMAMDIKCLLEELQVKKVMMFGHSLGGYVTLSFAEQFPEMLLGYSLIHSTAHPDSEEARQGRTETIDLISENGIEPFIKSLIPKLFAPENIKLMDNEVDYVSEIGLNTSVSGAKGALRAMKDRKDFNPVLKTSKFPVLLLAGEHDQIMPMERVFSETSPSITQIILDGAGHMSMIEKSDELTKIMLDFMKHHIRPVM